MKPMSFNLSVWLCLSVLATVLPLTAMASAQTDTIDGRAAWVHVPQQMKAGPRALVIVLHGGLGSAAHIVDQGAESALNMDSVADQDGFVVAYLNGTPVSKRLGPQFLGWNAGGGCCGVPAETGVDDVTFVRDAIGYLVDKYGIDPKRVYGIGHSNGAMMTLRILCESDIYAGGISVSGPLMVEVKSCPAAKDKPILSIHGADDANVPIAGGRGTKGFSGLSFKPESYTQSIMSQSGAKYRLQIVDKADHSLANIETQLKQSEGLSLAQKAAQFFGLEP